MYEYVKIMNVTNGVKNVNEYFNFEDLILLFNVKKTNQLLKNETNY